METLTCPNCGAEVDSNSMFCPNCGLRRGPPPAAPGASRSEFDTPPPAPRQSAGRTAWQIISGLLFVFIGIPAALFGACLLMLAGSTGSGKQNWDAQAIAVVYGPILLAALLLGLFIMSFFKRKK